MELGINWFYIISLFILAVTPWILKRSEIKIFFDSKVFDVSDSIHAFTSILSVTAFLVNSEKVHTQTSSSSDCQIIIYLLPSIIFLYFGIFLIWHTRYKEDVVSRNFDQLSYLIREKELALESGKKLDGLKQKELCRLRLYARWYKFLLLLSAGLYCAFYYQLAIIFAKISKYN